MTQKRYEMYKRNIGIMFVMCVIAFVALLVGATAYRLVTQQIKDGIFTNELTDESTRLTEISSTAVSGIKTALSYTEKADKSNTNEDKFLVYTIDTLNRNDETLQTIEFYSDNSVRVIEDDKAYWADGEILITLCNGYIDVMNGNDDYELSYDYDDYETYDYSDYTLADQLLDYFHSQDESWSASSEEETYAEDVSDIPEDQNTDEEDTDVKNGEITDSSGKNTDRDSISSTVK